MRLLQKGQATIEAAIVLPLLVLLVILFGALQIRIEAQSEIEAATSLAVAAAVVAPVYPSSAAGLPVPKDCAAQRTFRDTITQYSYFSTNTAVTYLSGNGPLVGANVCPGVPAHNGCGPSIRSISGQALTNPTISCIGHAQLSAFALRLGWTPITVSIQASANATASPYRTDCGLSLPLPPC